MVLNKAKAISVLSTEYLHSRVNTTLNGLPYDVTEGTVEFAFIDDDANPVNEDWVSAEWETAGPDYFGLITIGPDGAVTLTEGSYQVWIRVTLSPQTVVEPVGSILIY